MGGLRGDIGRRNGALCNVINLLNLGESVVKLMKIA